MKQSLILSEKLNQIMIIVFSVLSFFLLLNHEPWRDEGRAWLIARDSPNVISLIHLMGYEGTPALWHLILFPMAKLGLPYFSIAVVNFLVILSAVIIFISYAPFSKSQKILFVFGYYIFYEYNIIARSYALSVLFLFLIAFIYKERFQKPTSYSLLILLLANTNVYSLNFAIVLSGVYIFESNFKKNINITIEYFVSFLVMLFGILIAIYQLLPPADLSPEFAKWNFDLTTQHIWRISNSIVGATIPIPYPRVNFWNSILVYHYSYRILNIVVLPVFFLSLLFFIKKPEPMVIYILSSASLFGMFSLKYLGYLRHHGLLFIIFIFSLWISKAYNERLLIKNQLICNLFSQKNLTYLLGTLLLCHVVASPIAFYYDLKYDFSAGEKTANFLKENGFIGDDTFIAIYPSFIAESILPYIPKPYSQFYFIESQEFRSYTLWNTEYYNSHILSIQEIVDRVDTAILNKRYNTILLILRSKVEDKKEFSERYNLIAYFNKTIDVSDCYYIYKLVKPKPYSARQAMAQRCPLPYLGG